MVQSFARFAAGILSLLAALAFAVPAHAALGDPVRAYGTNGSTVFGSLAPPPVFEESYDSIRLGDNSTIHLVYDGRPGVRLVKLDPDGAVDTSYGNGGTAQVPGSLTAIQLTPTPAGGIQVVAFENGVNPEGFTTYTGHVVRFTSAGQLDAAWGSGGTVRIDDAITVGSTILPDGGSLVPSGHIVIGTGENGLQVESRLEVLRFSSDGTLIATELIDGVGDSEIDLWIPYSAELAPGGKTTITGAYGGNNLATVHPFAARVNPNGTRDATFDGDGISYTAPRPYAVAARHLVNPDGSILAVGNAISTDPATGASREFPYAAKWRADGALDPAFGTGGEATLALPGRNGFSTGITVDRRGRIILAGNSQLYPESDACQYACGPQSTLYRLRANGTPDTTFASGGMRLIHPEHSNFFQIDTHGSGQLRFEGSVGNAENRNAFTGRLSAGDGVFSGDPLCLPLLCAAITLTTPASATLAPVETTISETIDRILRPLGGQREP